MGVCFGVGEIVPKKIKELESKVVKLEEELKAYRDAEEQGLLLRLPCKVGDTVYCFYHTFDFEERKVHCEIVTEEFEVAMIDDFGKTVFLTKEEAEQKLESMKGE